MNPWAEFQQYQDPSNLGAMLATPQAPPPSGQATQGASPPTSPEDYARRVQGWTGALQELVSNPGVAAMLIQMGTGLSQGQSGGQAIQQGFGAMGRVGGIQKALQDDELRQQMEERRFGLEEKKFGLDERELGLREQLMQAQLARLRGGGSGGAAGISSKMAEENQALDMYLDAAGVTDPAERNAVRQKYWRDKLASGTKQDADAMKSRLEMAQGIEESFGAQFDKDPGSLSERDKRKVLWARGIIDEFTGMRDPVAEKMRGAGAFQGGKPQGAATGPSAPSGQPFWDRPLFPVKPKDEGPEAWRKYIPGK